MPPRPPPSRPAAAVAALLLGSVAPLPAPGQQQPAAVGGPAEPPAFVRRGEPGPEHRRLEPLVGVFRVEKTLHVGPGTPERPVVARDLACVRRWVGGGRYLEDVTFGTVADAPYWREGHLGFSTMDRRYEWVTVDALNSNMMVYRGEPVAPGAAAAATAEAISVSGSFTDQGLLGDDTAGKPVGMRAVFRIESDNRHVLDLHFTPPGGREFLADRSVYTRVPGTEAPGGGRR